MKLAIQQSQDMARARQAIEAILSGGKVESPVKEQKAGSERTRPSSVKSKGDLKAHFMDPPAPPPQAPLPEKPDVARALADPIIQPLLRRSDTARPPSASSSPTRTDHSGDILRLCEELKLAKGELSNQNERMKSLENELAQERTARESAEERAQRLERRDSPRRDSPTGVGSQDLLSDLQREAHSPRPDLQAQLERLRMSMDDMKQQMEAFRQRAETAETERDEARQTLAEMVEQKRRENAERKDIRSSAKTTKFLKEGTPRLDGETAEPNGHVSSSSPASPTRESLLERSGIEEGQPITPEQAKIITQFLTQEVLGSQADGEVAKELGYYAKPYGSAAAVVMLGILVMTWMNGWPKIER